MAKQQFICTACHHVGNRKKVTPGSFWIELFLWLFFVLPGVVYSLYRFLSKKEVCEACGNPTMIPTNTPKGQELLKEVEVKQA